MSQPISRYQTRYGTIAHFSIDQVIGKSLATYGEWAEDEIAFLRDYVAPGSVVVDAGANVGVHTLAFARMVGETGKVIAVDGQPEIIKLLTHNIAANKLSDIVEVVPCLLGSRYHTVPYTTTKPSGNMGAASFLGHVVSRNHEALTVIKPTFSSWLRKKLGLPEDLAIESGIKLEIPLITLDSLKLEECTLIKADIEGMEEELFLGARETLRRLRPALYFEYANGNIPQLTRMYELLKELRYRLFWHVANPFNSTNFKKEKRNIFNGALEVNIFALQGNRKVPNLPEILDPTVPPVRPSPEECLAGVAV